MKSIHKTIIVVLILPILASCSDWLDISPKSQIKVSDNYTNEQGFKDALTGVYLLMTKPALYGRDLTYGLVDILGKQYTQVQSSSNYYYLSQYDYTNQYSLDIIDGVWAAAYNTIANINLLIDNIDKSDPAIFTANNRRLIKGEAYGLRAYLSFDLLRLFGYSMLAGEDEKAIPYVTTYGKELTPFSTTKETIEKILADIDIAVNELKADPVYENREPMTDDESWTRNRELKLNYYAIKLLRARVNLYKGDYQSAMTDAQEVVDQSHFDWTPSSEITTTSTESRNRIFSQEMIFGLHVPSLKDDYDSWFTSPTGYYKSNYYWEQTFEVSLPGYSADYRFEYLTHFDPSAYIRYSTKLQQSENVTESYSRKLPLMRLSEAYYILSECKYRLSGVAEATPYLNFVRAKRNIMVELSTTISGSQFINELLKEHMKEFVSEGQLFFFYKRHNMSSINYHFSTILPETYVLPIPLEELANR